MSDGEQQQDRFTASYGVWFALFLILTDANIGLNLAPTPTFALFILLLLSLTVGIFLWPATLARHLWHRRWRRVVSLIAGTIVAFSLFSGLRLAGLDTTWVSFQLHKQSYLADIAKLPQDNAHPRLLSWPWDKTGFAGIANSEESIVYDESDQLDLTEAQRSLAWKQRAWAIDTPGKSIPGYRLGSDAETSVRRLEGHFYLVTEIYD